MRCSVIPVGIFDVEDSYGNDSTPADIFAINARLGRGINFGNALEANYEGQWGMWIKSDRGVNHSEFLATVDAKSAYSSSSLVSA